MTSQDPAIDTADEGPEGFRDAKKKVEAERDEAQTALQAALQENVAFKVGAAGLNPEQGIGKSIVKDINRGDYDGEITPSALAAYAAEEYGEKIEVNEDPVPVEREPDNDLSESQGEIDQIQTVASSQPASILPPVDVIGELQTEMLRPDATPEEVDRAVKSSITLKAQKLQQDWKAGRIKTTPEP